MQAVADRFYDPTTGQFLTRDPANALTRSAYGYVGGNPLNATDPSGLYCLTGVSGHEANGDEICNGAGEVASNAGRAAVRETGGALLQWAGSGGWCVSGTAGLFGGGQASGCIVGTRDGSLGFTFSRGPGVEMLGTLGISTGPMISNAPCLDSLKGKSGNVGFSGGEGPTVGGDFGFGKPDGEPFIWTANPSVGIGVDASELGPVEGHGESITTSVWQWW